MLTQAELKAALIYDPETGVFHWLRNRGAVRAGDVAGHVSRSGYVQLRVGKLYYAHRLAWLYVTGEQPEQIDHINGNPQDNRFANLRACNNAENAQNIKLRANNKSGHPGVSWHRQTQKWYAQIMVDGRRKNLGLYETPEVAGMVYRYWKHRLHTFNPTVRAA